MSIDLICETLENVDLIRVNTNNYELEVIKSANNTLINKNPELCIQCGKGNEVYVDELLLKYNYVRVKNLQHNNAYFVRASTFSLVFIAIIDRLPYTLTKFIKWRRFLLEWNKYRRKRHSPLHYEPIHSCVRQIP